METNLSNSLEQINEKVDSITTKLCLLEKKAEEVLSIFNSFENFVSKDLSETSDECSDTSTENSNTSENDIYDSDNDEMDSDELFLLKKCNQNKIDAENSNDSEHNSEHDSENDSEKCNDCNCSNENISNHDSNNSEILENLLNVLHQQKNSTNTDKLLDDLINNVNIKD